jgi:TPR repeat protein
MYVNGEGISKDYVEAVKWLSVAVSEGDRDSVDALDQVVARMTPVQIEKAKQMAETWKPCQGKAECDNRLKK